MGSLMKEPARAESGSIRSRDLSQFAIVLSERKNALALVGEPKLRIQSTDVNRNDPSRLKSTWITFFVLGVLMLNFPFLQTVNKEVWILGIPLLLLYFFVGWPLAIGIIYLFSKAFLRNLK